MAYVPLEVLRRIAYDDDRRAGVAGASKGNACDGAGVGVDK